MWWRHLDDLVRESPQTKGAGGECVSTCARLKTWVATGVEGSMSMVRILVGGSGTPAVMRWGMGSIVTWLACISSNSKMRTALSPSLGAITQGCGNAEQKEGMHHTVGVEGTEQRSGEACIQPRFDGNKRSGIRPTGQSKDFFYFLQ